jgi:hypothetical protein
MSILLFTGSDPTFKWPVIAITYPSFAYIKLCIEYTSTDFLAVGRQIYRHALANETTLSTRLSQIPHVLITLVRAETFLHACNYCF